MKTIAAALTKRQSAAMSRVALDFMEFSFEHIDGGICVRDEDSEQQAFAYLDAQHPDGVNAVYTKGNRSAEAITRVCQAVWHRTPHFSDF